MTLEDLTKKDLIDQVHMADAAAEAAREEAKRWREFHMADGEAEAISGCVKALDALFRGSGQNVQIGSTYRTTSRGAPDARRVLRYLADRYGVEWFDPPVLTQADPYGPLTPLTSIPPPAPPSPGWWPPGAPPAPGWWFMPSGGPR